MKRTDEQKLIIGNWKMYKTIDETAHFIKSLLPILNSVNDQVGLAVPFTVIKIASDVAKGSNLWIGAQNINDSSQGAFTGEVAAGMIKDAGANFCLIGHSERRRLFGESNTFINRKVKKALAEGIQVILCIGETLDDRESGQAESVLNKQLQECLEGLKAEDAANIIIAYEPVWAIGTGKSATPEIVEQTHEICRKVLKEIFGQSGIKMPIIYGGSASPENAKELLERKQVHGLLIGSASLNPESFLKIIQWREVAHTSKKR